MRQFHKKIIKKISAPPGVLIHVGEQFADKVSITQLTYDLNGFEEKTITDMADIVKPSGVGKVTWINISGLHDTDIMRHIGDLFNIDSLVQEDILNTTHRPKIENYNDYVLQIIKMLNYDRESKQVRSEQISIIMGPDYVITFQEREGDVFGPVRDRIRGGNKRINKNGSDYLVYSLTDAVVDNYFLVIEQIGDAIEIMEDELLENTSTDALKTIQRLRKEIIYLRKAVWPLREILNSILRNDLKMIRSSNLPFFRDIYDHTIQVIETTETFRDLISGLQDLHLSTMSNNMNQVMKVLTIIATIFIPLTFIAGIYGMNFEYMPELQWKAGYFIIWGLMIIVGFGMVLYFKRKKWL